jgi:hypothetical protein
MRRTPPRSRSGVGGKPEPEELRAKLGIRDNRIRELYEEITASRLAAEEARASREAGEGHIEAMGRERARMRERIRDLEEELRGRRRRREGFERQIARLERELARKDGEISRRVGRVVGGIRRTSRPAARRCSRSGRSPVSGPAMGGGADALVVQPLPSAADPWEKKPANYWDDPLRMCMDHAPCIRGFWIGS